MDRSRHDYWRLPALGLWLFFLATGYAPEWTFRAARQWGHVVTQDALINSHHLITLAWAVFLAAFVFQRCREAALSADRAWRNAVQILVLALAAFLSVPFELVLHFREIQSTESQRFILAVFGIKTLCLIYLIQMLLRYYLWGGLRVFEGMASFYPAVAAPVPEPAGAGTVPEAQRGPNAER